MKDANDTMKRAESRHKVNIEKFESKNRITCSKMDEVGTRELTILKSFQMYLKEFREDQNLKDIRRMTLNYRNMMLKN